MFGFSTDEVKTLQRAALSTWDNIAYDCLAALQETEGQDSIPRAEVIELVLDADYMKQFVHDSSLYKRFRELTYEKMKTIVLPVFPFKRYGM